MVFKKYYRRDCNNHWSDNYWDNSIPFIGVKIIIGLRVLFLFDMIIPTFQFDLRTADEPYDIKVD